MAELTFELQEGEILGLIGPNGAGKTTVFNCLSGVLVPDEGDILFHGQSLMGKRPFQICRNGLARTFQIAKPFLSISVFDNVMIGALSREKSTSGAKMVTREVLELTGLSGVAHRSTHELTLSLRKQLELARALATQPDVLLLDEVMAGLNPIEAELLMELIREINQQGVSILLVEHMMRGVMALSNRVIVINFGRKIAEGLPHEVVKDQGVIEAYQGSFLNKEEKGRIHATI